MPNQRSVEEQDDDLAALAYFLQAFVLTWFYAAGVDQVMGAFQKRKRAAWARTMKLLCQRGFASNYGGAHTTALNSNGQTLAYSDRARDAFMRLATPEAAQAYPSLPRVVKDGGA